MRRPFHLRHLGPRAGLLLAAMPLALAPLTGCLPSRVTIDLRPATPELAETVVAADPAAPNSSAKVALIDISGFLSHAPMPGLLATNENSIDSLVARLEKAEHDSLVKAVVLRVNSPGGTVAASQTAYAELAAFRIRSGKPIVISMADVAASGGYYISLAADRIVAQPSSITGSVGVILQTFNFSRGMDRLGIEGRAIVSRPNKDIANPFEPAQDEHFAILQGMVDGFYSDFRGLVQEKRPGIDPEEFDTATDGRVFTGRQALDIGLVDQLGTLRDAFATARDLAGVEHARLVRYHAEHDIPLTPYATSSLEHGPAAGSGPAQVNIFQLNLPDLPAHGGAGFYYVWAP